MKHETREKRHRTGGHPPPRRTYCGIPPYLRIPGDDQTVEYEVVNPIRTEYTNHEWLYRTQILFVVIVVVVSLARAIGHGQ